MAAWRKKPEGFEWHRYIRTTIKVRREQRRERIQDARRAAAEQMNVAGAALAAGSRAAGAAAKDGARAGLGVAGMAAQGFLNMAWVGLVIAGQKLAVAARPLIELLARPKVGGVIGVAAAIALGLGIGRSRVVGLDGEALTVLSVGVALAIAALPLLSRLTGIGMPAIPGVSAKAVAATLAVAAVVGAIAWFANRGSMDLASVTGSLPIIGGGKPLEGRAQALGGDLLRIGATTVRLAGVEAPEREQRCGKGANRQWRCGAAAQSALDRLAAGKVTCTLSGTDSAGRSLAYCTRGKRDINAELVRGGHAFAESGLFARYTSLEREAKAAKAGLWSAGEAERPAEYRAKVWDEAKRRAPDGCPIKGLITSAGARVYVLPWSPDYERGRMQKARGDRWFCSEQEAVGAGWKAAVRG